MEVAHAGAEGPTAQEPLDRMQIGARLQEVRGEGMAERVDAPALRDPRPRLGRGVELLKGPPRAQSPSGPWVGLTATQAADPQFPSAEVTRLPSRMGYGDPSGNKRCQDHYRLNILSVIAGSGCPDSPSSTCVVRMVLIRS